MIVMLSRPFLWILKKKLEGSCLKRSSARAQLGPYVSNYVGTSGSMNDKYDS